ncbi:tail attachment protein [Hafnia phage yong3]|nr:tail attachment protein [Hafnia phage yong3]
MSFPYEQLVETAKQLIRDAGTQCYIVVKENDPNANEWDAPTIERRIPFIGVFLTPKEKMIAGSLVASGEQKVLAAPFNPPLTREQALTATIERGTETWTVNAFVATKPATTEVLYTFKVFR